ncbi:unnamed protein product [Plutella xylostella]|uniref:(diamondback moth) hypothetical protein n=1 Tax=Plutella xylostella TaxID=51655 RepID=A0A8S4FX97_PLUXY|nr:unnamed protein product [Plutella xylostella]
MSFTKLLLTLLVLASARCQVISPVHSDMNFRVEPGARTCFFERARAGQTLEAQYQVLDGQHGDLDISFDIIDPSGSKILSDYKKPQNAIIMDLTEDGDYAFCMDNTYSRMNSKLVFVYVLLEDKIEESTEAIVEEDQNEEVLEWMGVDENGEQYFVEIRHIAASMSRTLAQVVRARHMMDLYAATKTRDSYLAFEETFVVDAWSALQICCMVLVGAVQVYMIKKLFNKPSEDLKSYY